MQSNRRIFIVSGLVFALAVGFFVSRRSAKLSGGGDPVASQGVITDAERAGKKVFVQYRTEAFRSLDPHKQYDEASTDLVSNLYDTLLEYSYLERPYKLQPSLVTKMPEQQKDPLEYVFELRKGVLFNDDACFPGGKGREMTADDIVYSIKRFADNNVNNQSYILMQGNIAGLDEFREQTKKLGKATDYSKLEIAGVKKIDKYHVKIRLTKVNPLALYPFASAELSIIPREAAEKYGDEFERHPVGSGPFYLKSLERRGVIVLAKNPNYWGTYPTVGEPGDKEAGLLEAAGKKLPFIDEVNMPLIEETQPAMLSFLKGEIDDVAMDKDNFVKMAQRTKDGKFELKDYYKGKIQIYSTLGLDNEYINFNMKDAVVGGYDAKHKALRQAIGYALDTPGFVELLKNGRGVALNSLIPIQIAGSEHDIPGTKYFDYNVAKAKEKLVEAGFPGGKGLEPIVFEYRASTTATRQDFEYVRSNLAKVGIPAKANFETFSAWLQKTEKGNYQIAVKGWQADYPDGENFYQLFWGPNLPPGPNDGSYENKEYDALYEKIKFMANGPERFALFDRMNKILMEDVPGIVTWNSYRVGLTHNWVHNFKRNMMYNPPLRFIDVDQKVKGVTH